MITPLFGLLLVGGALPLLANIAFAPRLARVRRAGGSKPKVSVCVPARNEARNIEGCLAALLAQEYQNVEILVLDDRSEDETASLVERFSKSDPRVRLLRGGELPAGWLGKSFACFQLSRAATGDILLFLDCDVRPRPEAIAYSVARMEEKQLGLLTVFPEQHCGTWAEKLIIPLIESLLYATLFLPLVRLTNNPHLSAANGQWMMFNRLCYAGVGGHEVVRSAIVEDIKFAQAVKRWGGRVEVFAGTNLISCRMYHSWREVFLGLKKNILFLAGGSKPFSVLTVVLCGVVAAGVVSGPFLHGVPLTVWTMGVAWLLLHRLLTAATYNQPRLSVWLFPVGFFMVFLIGLSAIIARKTRWKGRTVTS